MHGEGGVKMSEVHPREAELIRFGDGEASTDVAEHLRWCAHCRSVVADYRWLQREIVTTLAAAADAVPVPRSKWWAVQEVLFATQQRLVVGWRVSAVASVVLAVCLMLSLSPVLGVAVAARTLPPAPMIAPAPATTVVSGEQKISRATPTPVVSSEEVTPLPTPALMLPPTPPQLEI